MLKRLLLLTVVIFFHSLTFESVSADEQKRNQEKVRSLKKEPVYSGHIRIMLYETK